MDRRCPHCGKQVSDKAVFCRFCGVRIDEEEALKKVTENRTASEQQVQDTLVASSKEYSEPEKSPENIQISTGKAKLPKSMIAIIAIAAVMAVAVAIVGVVMYLGTSDNPGNQPEITDNESEESQPENGNTEIGEISNTKGIVISSCDWDWEVMTPDGPDDPYVVDAIFWVRNDSQNAIVGIEYDVYSKDGEYIENALEAGATRFAYGYVAPGESGIMIGKAWTYKKVGSSDLDTRIVSAYINNTMPEYVVPSGKIINYTKETDSYDVSMNNENGTPVNSTAKLVMALEENGTIQNADATGNIENSIPDNTKGFVQKDAFVDPGIHGEFGKMSVYAIDFYAYGIDGRYFDNNEW